MGGGKETLEEVQTSANSHAAKATEYETEAINMAGILTTDAFVLLETNVKKFAADSRKDASDAQTKTDLDACDTDRDNAEKQKISAEKELINMLQIFAKQLADDIEIIFNDVNNNLPNSITSQQQDDVNMLEFYKNIAQTNLSFITNSAPVTNSISTKNTIVNLKAESIKIYNKLKSILL